MNALDPRRFRALSFDCYGTLIDWEAGILDALGPLRAASNRRVTDDEILEVYARSESRHEAGTYRRYREILRLVLRDVAAFLSVPEQNFDADALSSSVENWRPFPDTVEALRLLNRRFRLAVVSNIDDDLFAGSARRLGVVFDHVITAEQVGAYKPSRKNFLSAIDRIGVGKTELLHVAQSLFHDVNPAGELGIATVWVNRRKNRRGAGATPPADARPDLEVPDLITLARMTEGDR